MKAQKSSSTGLLARTPDTHKTPSKPVLPLTNDQCPIVLKFVQPSSFVSAMLWKEHRHVFGNCREIVAGKSEVHRWSGLQTLGVGKEFW